MSKNGITDQRIKSSAARPTVLSDYLELTKARIVVMVVLTTIAGFYLAALGSVDVMLLVKTVIGTGLVVASANTLNQLIEKDTDAKMRRTENRPLPSGRMDSRSVFVTGAGMAIVGTLVLALGVNKLTAILAVVSWANYLFLYTPLKKKTSLSTLIGAISGALPPVIGWAAARNDVSLPAWNLFLILFFWQLPHFLAIAWIYREDYARGGFPMLPVVDQEGSQTGRQIVIYGLALVPLCLMPTLLGLAGKVYFIGALVLGSLFLWFGIRMAFYRTSQYARHLLLASLVFLPVLLGLMMLDKGPL